MADRTAEMKAAVEQRLARNRAAVARRQAKRQRSNPAAELHREWVIAVKEHFAVSSAPWGGAEYALGKRLVGELGYERAAEVVRYFVATWKSRRTGWQERRDDLPSMKLCWTLRGRIEAELDGHVRCPESKREKVLRGEYDPDSAAASPDRGWGERDY